MKIVTPYEMNEIDKKTINEFGISGVVLMENVALKVITEIEKEIGNLFQKKIIILAGKGNNGGDAFALARHLINNKVEVEIYLLAKKDEIKNDALINLKILEKMDIKIIELMSESQITKLKFSLFKTDLIIDGIFGIGITKEIIGITKEIINLANKSNIPIISIDMPSGINGKTGEIHGIAINAKKTVTFAFPKLGQFLYPGCEYIGKLVISDIGIPKKVLDSFNIKNNIIDDIIIKKLLPQRKKDSNKKDFGKIFIVTGSVGMTGAGCLTAKAALRTGCGLVYLGVPASLCHIYESQLTESITIPLDDTKGYFRKECINELNKQISLADVVVVGPGLSQKEDIFSIVSNIILNSHVPIVLDADALNALSKDTSILNKSKSEIIITPHPGEMSRLTGISIEEIQNNRIEVAREFSLKFKIITVLKGF